MISHGKIVLLLVGIWVTEKVLVSRPALLITYTNKEKGLETSNARATYVVPFRYSNCCSFQI